MHMLVYHVPKFLSDEQGLKIFTGQGVEKTNDVVRVVYQRKSNKLDSCKDTLMALKRRDLLVAYEKKPNSYNKHDDAYWTQQISEDRRKRPRRCKPSDQSFAFTAWTNFTMNSSTSFSFTSGLS